MNILVLAPQPFYQERGTPIAVRMLLQEFSQANLTVDLLTYHEGEELSLPNVTIHRIRAPMGVRNLRPGFSWKKVVCDAYMFAAAIRLVARRRYQLIYAVEESVFIALLFNRFLRLPYVYDMDSSLTQQLIAKYPALRAFRRVLLGCEASAVRNAALVVPMCDALADTATGHGAAKTIVLRDAPFPITDESANETPDEDLRAAFGISEPLGLYVGNLEIYQGVDLMLDAFAEARRSTPVALVIIGGTEATIEMYRAKAEALGVADAVYFAGTRPLTHLHYYLAQADFLISPRLHGVNTPMKLYHYLQSGRAVLATDLPTHTQVLTPGAALLCAPATEAFAEGIARLATDASLREAIGAAGKALVEASYSYAVFQRTVASILEDLVSRAIVPVVAVPATAVSEGVYH